MTIVSFIIGYALSAWTFFNAGKSEGYKKGYKEGSEKLSFEQRMKQLKKQKGYE